ncbi:hypothetical protein BVRB_028180 [Beta vulgaris subsp. vulgaris]|uniref:Uncharacterized protein n=1 Tax=Beta vulgaris subsp. vulgaris TaxID=3555 RepID=A0A0J8AYH2_BETVV|nr:hypothetical protein BVRB_028180 [Beta vulgaris subsp. vulgaris]
MFSISVSLLSEGRLCLILHANARFSSLRHERYRAGGSARVRLNVTCCVKRDG